MITDANIAFAQDARFNAQPFAGIRVFYSQQFIWQELAEARLPTLAKCLASPGMRRYGRADTA